MANNVGAIQLSSFEPDFNHLMYMEMSIHLFFILIFSTSPNTQIGFRSQKSIKNMLSTEVNSLLNRSNQFPNTFID